MWKPADNLVWHRDSACSQQDSKLPVNLFFSKIPEEKYQAKMLCYSCPVRRECLQWALEHKQIWGIWGGKDEVEIRRALSVSFKGEETRRRRFPNCPYCSARPSKLSVHSEELTGGGRWTTAKIVTCSECGFCWRSRTSANAVNAYFAERKEKAAQKERLRREKKKRL